MILHIKNTCHKFSTTSYSVSQQNSKNKNIDEKNLLKAMKYRNIILSLKVLSQLELLWRKFQGHTIVYLLRVYIKRSFSASVRDTVKACGLTQPAILTASFLRPLAHWYPTLKQLQGFTEQLQK